MLNTKLIKRVKTIANMDPKSVPKINSNVWHNRKKPWQKQ